MALGAAELALVLTAQDNITKVLGGVDTALAKTEKAVTKKSGAFSAAKTAVGAFAGVMGSSVVGALSDAARAAADDEASVARLGQAVENAGASFENWVPDIEALIVKNQGLAFADDQTRDSLARLIPITGNVGEAMKLNALAMDLARGKNIDLATASEIVGKVAAGNTGILGRYGIVLGEGATAAEALGAIQAKFAGQAEAYGNSSKGAIDKIKDAIGEKVEGIGAAMGPFTTYIALLPGLTSGMTLAGGAIGALTQNLNIAKAAKLASIPVMHAVGFATNVMLGPIGLVIAAVAFLALAWSQNWFDIQGKTEGVVAALTSAFEGFSSFFVGLWQGLASTVGPVIENITAPIRTVINLASSALGFLSRLGVAQSNANTSSSGGSVGGATRGYSQGTGFVGSTGLAMLHRGERVVTAEENRRGGGRGGDVHVHFGGSVYGIPEFEEVVRGAVAEGKRRGGFHGSPVGA